MLRATLRTLLFVPALALASCASADPSEETVGEADEEIYVGYAPFAGTFRGEPRSAGDFALLVLKTDGTYHAGKLVYCVTAPCPPIGEDGHYRLFRRQLATYLALIDPSGHADYYQYARRGAWLGLRRPSGDWQSLEKSSPAWCDAPNDCALQHLPTGPCVGRWRCEEATCRFSCGFGPPRLAGEPEPCDG